MPLFKVWRGFQYDIWNEKFVTLVWLMLNSKETAPKLLCNLNSLSFDTQPSRPCFVIISRFTLPWNETNWLLLLFSESDGKGRGCPCSLSSRWRRQGPTHSWWRDHDGHYRPRRWSPFHIKVITSSENTEGRNLNNIVILRGIISFSISCF